MPRRSQPSCASGKRSSRWRATCSASSSLPSSTRSTAALELAVSSSSASSVSMSNSSKLLTMSTSTMGRHAAAARRSCSAATSLSRQQRLYFLPLPHGQGSLRPGLAITVSPSTGRMHPLYRTLLGDARFHELLLAFDRDLAPEPRRVHHGAVPAQAAWRAGRVRRGARPTLQLLLLGGSVPPPQ